jgi:SM-20-related protein
MTTLPSSANVLHQATLDQLANDLAARGLSILPVALEDAACASLLTEAHRLDAAGRLRAAGVGRNRATFSDIRGDRILWLDPGLTPVTDEFLRMTDQLRTHLNRHLYLGLSEYEGHLACYRPGTGYQKHLDRIHGSNARVVTLIAYLNPAWRNEDGGQLRLHLGETVLDVTPQAGTVVAFLSGEYWHEVVPSFRDRWAISGWFRCAPSG